MLYISRYIINLIVELLIDPTLTGAGPLDGCVAHLWKNSFTPNELSVAADFEEADFTGYTSKPVTWGPVGIAADGTIEAIGNSVSWNQTGTTVTNTAYGVYYTTAGGVYLYAEKFPTPWSFTAADRIESLTPKFRLPR